MALLSIVDAIAVADVAAVLAAVPPDGVLYEPGEDPGERRVEGSRVDPARHGLDDVGAAARLIAGCPVDVLVRKPMQNAGAVQMIMHERIDGDHAATDLQP